MSEVSPKQLRGTDDVRGRGLRSPGANGPRAGGHSGAGVTKRRWVAAAVAACLLAMAAASLAQSRSDVGPNAPATQFQVIELGDRVERLERAFSGLTTESMREQETLLRELRELRDEVERLGERVRGLETRLEATAPVAETRGERATVPAAAGGEGVAAGRSADAQALTSEADAAALYRSGLTALREGRNEAAARAFDQYIEAQPEGEFVADAWFWLAEARATMRDRLAAIETFGTVVERFPQSERAPEAWLQIGILHAERGESDDARRAFETLIERYPDHPAARLAQDRLERL